MAYNYNNTSIVNGNIHILTLATPIVRDGDAAEENQATEEPVVNNETSQEEFLDSPDLNEPYDYDNTSVVNGNIHTLTLTTPIIRDGGLVDYNFLTNKPSINSVTLQGNLSLDDLGIQPIGNYPNSPLSDDDLEHLIADEI